MKILALFAIALFATSSTASAEGCGEQKDAAAVVQHIFDIADQDEDGSLTQIEYEAAGLQEFGVTFQDSDTNADGKTSFEEYLWLYERHHPAGDVSEV